jgi:hypothetical protein
MEELKNLNRQLRIQDVLNVLITQSTKLIEIVNNNQKEVNRLKTELEQLRTHTDNATDQIMEEPKPDLPDDVPFKGRL